MGEISGICHVICFLCEDSIIRTGFLLACNLPVHTDRQASLQSVLSKEKGIERFSSCLACAQQPPSPLLTSYYSYTSIYDETCTTESLSCDCISPTDPWKKKKNLRIYYWHAAQSQPHLFAFVLSAVSAVSLVRMGVYIDRAMSQILVSESVLSKIHYLLY